MHTQPVPRDPSLPHAPLPELLLSEYCDCAKPILQARAERRGAAHTYCARCDREVPLSLAARWA